jgi:hypothetical protein
MPTVQSSNITGSIIADSVITGPVLAESLIKQLTDGTRLFIAGAVVGGTAVFIGATFLTGKVALALTESAINFGKYIYNTVDSFRKN